VIPLGEQTEEAIEQLESVTPEPPAAGRTEMPAERIPATPAL
jgi:hypothetical protein